MSEKNFKVKNGITASGNITTSGQFIGDGSQLSGVQSPAATPTSLGSVYGHSASWSDNTSLGNQANVNLAGGANTAIGSYSMHSIQNGFWNIALGKNSLFQHIQGNFNTAIGFSLQNSTFGSFNTAIGHSSLGGITTGIDNIAIGVNAGSIITTGGNNIIIGNDAQPSQQNPNNEITLGNNSITRLRIPGLAVDWDINTIPGAAAQPEIYGTVYGKTQGGFTALGFGAGKNTTNGDNVFIGSLAGGNNSLGYSNTYVGNMSGYQAEPNGSSNTIIGAAANPGYLANYATAIGAGSVASENSIAIGNQATAFASNSIVLGNNYITSFEIPGLNLSTQSAQPGQVLGWSNNTGNPNAQTGFIWTDLKATSLTSGTLFGKTNTNSTGAADAATGLGYSVIAGPWSATLGAFANGNGNSSVAIGSYASSTFDGSIAIGSGATTTDFNQIVIGGANLPIYRFTIPGLGIDWTSSTLPSATPEATYIISGKVYGTTRTDNSNTSLGYYSLPYSDYEYSNRNTAIGSESLYSNQSGEYNSTLGAMSMSNNTTGSRNVAIAVVSLYNNSSGYGNNAIGDASMYANTVGSFNNSVGLNSLRFNVSGNSNTAFGTSALQNNVDGSYNVGIGYWAGGSATNGSNNISIGKNAQPSSSTVSNEITLGNSDISRFRIPGLGIDWTSSTIPGNPAEATTSSAGILYGNTTTYNSAVLGQWASTDIYDTATLIGANTYATGNLAIAIGANASAGQNGISIGIGTSAQNNEVVIGDYNINKFRIPGLNLDTSDASNGKFLGWSDGSGNPSSLTGFIWLDAPSGGSWTHIGSVTSSGGSTVSFSGLNGAYKELMVTFENVTSNTQNSLVFFRFNSDSSSGNYSAFSNRDYGGSTYMGNAISSIYGCIGTMTAFGTYSSGSLKVVNSNSSSVKGINLLFKGRLSDWITSNYVGDVVDIVSGSYSGSAISSIDITLASGTFSTGNWKLWGLA